MWKPPISTFYTRTTVAKFVIYPFASFLFRYFVACLILVFHMHAFQSCSSSSDSELTAPFWRGYTAMIRFLSFWVQQKISGKGARIIVMLRYSNMHKNKRKTKQRELKKTKKKKLSLFVANCSEKSSGARSWVTEKFRICFSLISCVIGLKKPLKIAPHKNWFSLRLLRKTAELPHL